MNNIPYHKRNVILYFIFGMLFFVLPILLMIIKTTNFVFLIFPIILLILGGYFYYRICKAVFHIIINKSMIEFTSDEYIDNLNGVSLRWKNIKMISLEEGKAPFVLFSLLDKSLFYDSMKNPLKKIFYKIEIFTGKAFKTNILFAKGKNSDILNEIYKKYNLNK